MVRLEAVLAIIGATMVEDVTRGRQTGRRPHADDPPALKSRGSALSRFSSLNLWTRRRVPRDAGVV
jgi:hypothetical protein